MTTTTKKQKMMGLLTHYLSLHNAFFFYFSICVFSWVAQTVFCSGIKRRDYWKTTNEALARKRKGSGDCPTKTLSERWRDLPKRGREGIHRCASQDERRPSVVRRRYSTRRGRKTRPVRTVMRNENQLHKDHNLLTERKFPRLCSPPTTSLSHHPYSTHPKQHIKTITASYPNRTT